MTLSWPMNSEYIEFCIPTKCGSAMWSSLMIRYTTGKLPRHFPEPWLGTDLRINGFDHHKLLNNRVNKTIFISRHPFSRFLSGYLDKAATFDRRAKFYFEGRWNATPESFRTFVTKFSETYPNIGNHFAKLHFLPIDHYYECANRSSVHYKLEHMSEWYPSFVQKYNMVSAVNDPHWEGGCWWRRTNSTCNNSLIPTRAKNCLITRNKHHKNSCSVINKYYDETTKSLIYKIFKNDFIRSNYTTYEF